MANMLDMTARRGAGDAASRTVSGLVGRNITRRRKELGVTQGQLARALGVSQPMVSLWEHGEVDLTLTQLSRIAYQLDTSAAKLAKPAIGELPPDGSARDVLISELQDITRRLADLESDSGVDE